jgi:glutamate N-acetyltransferase/amino-acid N-acetyltransferase
MDDAKKMCEIAAKMLSLSPDKVAVASTGIIGRKMDIGAIEKVADKVSKDLTDKPVGSLRAAKAIMTTDTREKSLSFKYKGIEAGGICKGAGMISPQMATMLCFITTDADVDPKTLQECLRNAVGDSFNMLVIDDCMSTNDMVLLLSSGKVKCAKEDFQTLLNHLTKELAKLLALDGEGATKYIEVEVRGAKDRETARKAAKAIISSSLVKTAVHGENPNWGRIAAAMGSVIKYDFEKIDLFFESGSEKAAVVVKGVMKELEPARKILKNKELRITVDLNSGKESAVGYGCDLTCEYIKINAEYN